MNARLSQIELRLNLLLTRLAALEILLAQLENRPIASEN